MSPIEYLEYRTMYPGLPEVEFFKPVPDQHLDNPPSQVLIARALLRYVLPLVRSRSLTPNAIR